MFASNTIVSATGMQVKTVVQDNLLIAPATNGTADANGEDEASYRTAYIEPLKAILEPASTIDGVKYFYTANDNVVGSGDARSDNYFAYASSDVVINTGFYGAKTIDTGDYADEFSKNYGITKTVATGFTGTSDNIAHPYTDYAFYIKATNTTNASKDVTMTKLQLTYGDNTEVTHKAWRAAVFVDAMSGPTADAHGNVADMTLVSILRQSGATYFTSDSAVAYEQDVTTPSSISAIQAVNTKIDDAATIGSVESGATKYFKVVVRLWLEGEDNTCNNETFAKLTNEWGLDIVCKMDGTTTGVTNLALVQNIAEVNLVGASLSSTTKIVDNQTYTMIETITYNGQAIYVLGTSAISATSRVFYFDGSNPFEITYCCKLTA